MSGDKSKGVRRGLEHLVLRKEPRRGLLRRHGRVRFAGVRRWVEGRGGWRVCCAGDAPRRACALVVCELVTVTALTAAIRTVCTGSPAVAAARKRVRSEWPLLSQ